MHMVKPAANLTMLFNEVEFLDRFALAAENGFAAVEFLFPYPYPAQRLRALLDEAGLELGVAQPPRWGLAGRRTRHRLFTRP